MRADDERDREAELRGWCDLSDDDVACLQRCGPVLARSFPLLVERVLAALPSGQSDRPAPDAAPSADLRAALGAALALFLARRFASAPPGRHEQDGADPFASVPLGPAGLVAVLARLREELQREVRRVCDADTADAAAVAVGHACDVQAALSVAAVAEARQQARLTALRDVIVAHLPTGVVLLDADGRVTTSARPNPRVFGDAIPNGRHWREVLRPALVEAASLASRIERARKLRREIILPRLDVALPSGVGSFRVALTPLHHPLAEVLLHVEDLTDTLASEARATRAEQLTKLASMAATVAHEIRNPLAGVSAAVQVVAATLPHDDQRRGALTKVQEQVQRLGNLVGDLLSLSKPIALTPREVDLAAVAGAIATSDHGTVEVRGKGSALADVALLTQVLFNLVQNAWQAGARTVRVDVEGAALRVVDDGPGVADDLREQIFEPFFTTKTRGTGLGLPTARKIVEAMGGTLTICPSPLGGAGFEVRLPSQEERSAPDE
ncbi:MAG: hypothetical protein HYS27_16835 [Deltaproteobacteria bacterium]|nr:hypothetical protein [Deltaproteobacteria bacterium]